MEERIKTVSKAPASAGRTQLLRHLRGERLTARQAILAKCCDCMCYHVDGRVDCELRRCSLYPFMAYRERKGTP